MAQCWGRLATYGGMEVKTQSGSHCRENRLCLLLRLLPFGGENPVQLHEVCRQRSEFQLRVRLQGLSGGPSSDTVPMQSRPLLHSSHLQILPSAATEKRASTFSSPVKVTSCWIHLSSHTGPMCLLWHSLHSHTSWRRTQ